MMFKIGDYVQLKSGKIGPGVILDLIPFSYETSRSVRIQSLRPCGEPAFYWVFEEELEHAVLEELAAVLEEK